MSTRVSPTVRFWSRVVYVLLAVVVLAGLGLKVYWDRSYGTQQQRKQWMVQHQHQADQRFRQIVAQVRPLRGTTASIDAVKNAMGGRPRVVTRQGGDPTTTHYELIDREFGIAVDVSIASEGVMRWEGAETRYTAMSPLPNRRPAEERVHQLGRLLCPVIGGMFTPVVAMPWLVLLVLTRFFVSWRPLLFAGAFGVVVLSGLVWLMSPAYPLTSVQNVMSNDPMFWAGLMLMATAITWAAQRANRTVDPRLCLGCGYNLTANTTGECSECGAVIPGDQRRFLGEWWT